MAEELSLENKRLIARTKLASAGFREDFPSCAMSTADLNLLLNAAREEVRAPSGALAVERGGVPEGWVAVPREPTKEMWRAYIAADPRRKRRAASAKRDYRAMIAAAPSAGGER